MKRSFLMFLFYAFLFFNPSLLRAIPPPNITSLSPDSGTTAGGTNVNIIGTGFTGASDVQFDGISTSFMPVDDMLIMADSPPHAAGPVNVIVFRGVISSNSAVYTYTNPGSAPTVTNISPKGGPTTGGTTVAITGTGFTTATSVHFGSASASFIINSDVSITAISPAGTGIVDVTVTNSIGTSPTSAVDQYTYMVVFPVPVVTSVSPRVLSARGGTPVRIVGRGFTGATAVLFNDPPALSFIVESDELIIAISPPLTPGVPVTIQVVTPGGTSAITPDTTAVVVPGLSPPRHLRGKVVKNEFLTQTEYAHVITWRASSDPDVIGYQLSRNGIVIATVDATGPFRVVDHNRPKNQRDVYTLFGFDANGFRTEILEITLP